MSSTNPIGSNYNSSVTNTYNSKSGFQGYSIGDTFEATVIGFSKGKARLVTSDNNTFEASLLGISLNKGDVLNFKVLDSGSKGLTLQLMEPGTGGISEALPDEQLSSDDIMSLFKQSNFVKEEDNIFETKSVWEGPSEDEKELQRAIAAVENRLSHISNNVSVAVISQLLGHGVSLQNMRLELVDQVLREVEASPQALSDEALNTLVKENADALGINKEGFDQKLAAAAALTRHKLPLTPENMAHMEKTLSTFEEIKDLEDMAIISLLDQDNDELTMEDIYKAKYTNAGKSKDVPEEAWKDLSREVAKIFKREDLERSPENIAKAKFLVGNELPVDRQNLKMMTHLRNLENNYSTESLMNLSAQAIRQGSGPRDIPMTPEAIGEENISLILSNEQAAQYAGELTQEELAVAESLDIPLTLAQLREIASHREDYPQPAEPAAPSARLALMEVQLKLTTEAAYRLSRKGIEIDTLPLMQAVEELRALERKEYENALKAADIFPDAENVAAIAQVFHNLPGMTPLGAGTYRDLIVRQEPFTIATISQSQGRLLQEGYEIFMTAPNAKYGDSIGKVLPELPNLLEQLEIDPTDSNIRAAAILTRNQMDVTEENLLEIKLIDAKLDRIQDTLHPAIAAEMVKDGLNPLQMHVDDMLSYIESFNEEYGEGLKDKIPEYILDLDKKEELTSEERTAMVAVYRMMHQIDRYGGAAIGANIKAGGPPTFKNLLESAKYYSKTGARTAFTDKVVDDSQGEVERRTAQEQSIREILENTVHSATNSDNIEKTITLSEHIPLAEITPHHINQYMYSELLMKCLGDNLNPDAFQRLAAKNLEYMDMPLWELTERLSEDFNTEAYDTGRAQEIYRQITTELVNTAPQTVAWMEAMGVPITLRNIGAGERLLQNKGFPYDNAGKILEKIDVGGDTVLPDEGASEELAQAIDEALEDAAVDQPNKDLLREVRLIQTGVKVQNFISAKQDNYRIPVKVNGRLSTLNMYVPGGKVPEGNVNVAVSLETGVGRFNSFVTGSDGALQMTLNADGPLGAVLERSSAKQLLLDNLKDAGYEEVVFLDGDIPAQERELPRPAGEKSQSTKQDMFTLAKAIAKGLGEITQKNPSLRRFGG